MSEENVDILVITRDVYSVGAGIDYKSLNKGSLTVYDKNLLGIGHELKLNMMYNPDLPDSPGFGVEYNINNIRRSFHQSESFLL